jgi:hypothetical protein
LPMIIWPLHSLALLALDQREYGRGVSLLREALSLCRAPIAAKLGCTALAAFAAACAALGQASLAARLLGAADAGLARFGVRIEPYHEAAWAPLIAAARAACDTEVWAAATAAGQSMSLQEAVAYALAEGPPDA